MQILKFGGSSLADSQCIKRVSDVIRDKVKRGDNPAAVVVSAIGKSTDLLTEMAIKSSKGDESYLNLLATFRGIHFNILEELFEDTKSHDESHAHLTEIFDTLDDLLRGVFLVLEASPRTMDYVLSFGERSSAYIISQYLSLLGVESDFLDARHIITTNKNFGNAQVDFEVTYGKIRDHFSEKTSVQIVTGFISAAKGGLTTTLGRGGSDYTAALLGAALSADQVEIWTDVNGVLTADPRKVRKAFTIERMTYAEAVEMSHFGAKVIYPPTIHPLMEKEIPIYIKNTFQPDHNGTFISSLAGDYDKAVKGISSISKICLITLQGSGLFGVPGVAARLFRSLAEANINIILITQGSSEHSISFAIQPSQMRKACKRVEKEFSSEIERGSVEPLKIENDLSVIAIIGENMRYVPGVAGKMLTALGNNGINAIAIAQGSSELNISVVVNAENESKSLNVLHQAFFLSDTKVINLFMVGVGLIGSALLQQLEEQKQFLKEKRFLEIRVVALANTRKMIFKREGINLQSWKGLLEASAEVSELTSFVQQMKSLNLPNSVFVDNTANSEIPDFYDEILRSSISISTPNKIATSSDFDQYVHLNKLASKNNVYFGFETNVGAGLPVISTLRNLIDSGDRVIKIEGVLSGSLSYIFNHFDENTSFSEAVEAAGKLGYTEPDPRIDLNGVDVKRKILILAREAGMVMEGSDVEVNNILPEYCQKASLEELPEALKQADDHFESLRQKAASGGKKLKMIAKLENGTAGINLEAVDPSSPFYFLSGSDNMIVFTTERYRDRPLVVQGPGAGAEVTAAGVFAEIIHIGNLI